MVYPSFRGLFLTFASVLCAVSVLSAPAQAATSGAADHAKGTKAKHSAVKSVVKQPEAEQAKHEAHLSTSLSSIGYRGGIRFDSSQQLHQQTIYFRAPADGTVSSGMLHIVYGASRFLNGASSLRVSVNDISREVKSLSVAGENQVLDIPLTQGDIDIKNGGLVKVGFSSIVSVDRKDCPDEGADCGYVKIYPESTMQMTLDFGKDVSVRSAWMLLPDTTKISLPAGEVTPEIFAAAWAMHDFLARDGNEVKFVRLPEIGDVVVAPLEELRAALVKSNQEQTAKNLAVDPNSGASVFAISGHQTVALSEPFNVGNFFLLSGVEGAKRYVLAKSEHADTKENDRQQIMLSTLGLGNEPRTLSAETHQAEWRFGFGTDLLPFGYLPERLEFGVTVPPLKDGSAVMFYVYLNNILQRAVRLDSDGEKHQISATLSKADLSSYDEIRFVAQRVDDTPGTREVSVQLTADASLVVKREYIKEPMAFGELGLYFFDGFDTYLPKSYLQNPEQVIRLLSQLVVEQNLPVNYKRLSFFNPDAEINPSKPFLVVGKGSKIKLSYSPVRFDKGGYYIVDRDGNTLISIPETKDLGVAQIVQSGNVSGVWIDAGPSCTNVAMNSLRLKRDDVAMIDRNGVLLTFDSRDPNGSKVLYKDNRDWKTVLSENRFTVMMWVWVVMTLIVVYLFRQVRRHNRVGQ